MRFTPIIDPRQARLPELRLGTFAEGVRLAQWPTDDEVVAAIKSVPCHYVMTQNEKVALGWEAVMRINGTPFGMTQSDFELTWDKHEVGDSETGVNKVPKRGRFVATLSTNFYCKKDVNYHDAPLLIGTATNETMQIWIYPLGLGDAPYKLDPFVAFSYKLQLGKEAGEGKGSLSGESGSVLRPGE
jgi:hypothetical protein